MDGVGESAKQANGARILGQKPLAGRDRVSRLFISKFSIISLGSKGL